MFQEYLKPVFQSQDTEKILTAQKVLFRCLDTGLRLLSTFMPFITEELYQRLPRSDKYKTTVSSICVAPYPSESDTNFRDTSTEQEFEFIQKINQSVRSARSDYNIVNKNKTEAYVSCSDKETANIVTKFTNVIETLAFCSKIFVNVDPPTGCAILTISDKCEVHLLLKGLIDPEKEIQKLLKKEQGLEQTKAKLTKAMAAGDYEIKVPEEIRVNEKKKLEQTEGELVRLQIAMEALKLMS